MSSVVYWIAHKDHTDMFSQGYIGVSKKYESRWKYHSKNPENAHLRHAIQKYGWDNLQKKVVLIAESDYCFDIEAKLRPSDKMGWNIVAGGGKPPSSLGKKFGPRSEEHRKNMSKARKGIPSWNKGKKLTDKQKENMFNLAEYMKDKPHGMLGRSLSKESIESMRQKKIGKKQSLETIAKRAQTLTGKKQPKTVCPKCNLTVSIGNAKRYHFDNCKGSRPFKARVTIDGKRIYLGKFETKEMAIQTEAQAYKDANKPFPLEFIRLRGIPQWQV